MRKLTYKVVAAEATACRTASGKAVAAVAALALALAAAMPAFGAETIVRDGSSAETVLTGRVKEVEDVISVVLPSNIKMTIQTDERGFLDEENTKDVTVNVVNESRSTKAVRLMLYETTDDQSLLDEVILTLNGQDIKHAVGGASDELNLTGLIQPGNADTLTMAAASIGPTQVIGGGSRSVRTIIKATAV